jgi:putative nucleotidyltransferase with HDIG domain
MLRKLLKFFGSFFKPVVIPSATSATEAEVAPPVAQKEMILPPVKLVESAAEPIGVENLDQILRTRLEALPPVPEVALRILSELNSPNSSAKSIAPMASRDPGLLSTLLRMANSAAYSPVRPITDAQSAIALLGFSTVRAVLLRLNLSTMIGKGISSPEEEEIWTHSLAVAYVAEVLSKRMGGSLGLISTLGLLHDIGKLVVLHNRPKFEQQPMTLVSDDESKLGRERRIFGADHADIGAHLAARWGLPEELVTGIRYHHAPQLLPEDTSPELRRALCIVHLANQLTKYLHIYADDVEIDVLHESICTELGISADVVLLIDDSIRKAVTDALLLSAATLERAPGATGRLIRLTTPGSRAVALQNAMTASTAASNNGIASARESASVMMFESAAGDARPFHFRAGTSDASELEAIDRSLKELEASEAIRWRINLCVKWLVDALHQVDARASIDVVVARREDEVIACVRCDVLRFDRRFGGHVNPDLAFRVVEQECAGVLNLNWLKQVQCSADGGALLLAA